VEGLALQTRELEEMARNGFLYARVHHTMGKGLPVSARIIIGDAALTPRRQ